MTSETLGGQFIPVTIRAHLHLSLCLLCKMKRARWWINQAPLSLSSALKPPVIHADVSGFGDDGAAVRNPRFATFFVGCEWPSDCFRSGGRNAVFPSMPLPNNCHEQTHAIRSAVDIHLIHCVNEDAALFSSIHQNAATNREGAWPFTDYLNRECDKTSTTTMISCPVLFETRTDGLKLQLQLLWSQFIWQNP